MRRLNDQTGQIALVGLLLMTVLLTVGVSVASRGVSELRITRQEEDTTKAFEIAEQGVEEALSQIAQGNTNFECENCGDEQIKYNSQVSTTNRLEAYFEEGETAQITLDGATLGGAPRLRINWDYSADGSCNGEAAILVAVITNSGNVRREAARPSSCFADMGAAASIGNPDDDSQGHNVTIQSGDRLVRIKPLFSGTTIRVRQNGSLVLGPQSYVASSVARTQGGETRAVEVTRSLPAAPSIFDYVLFSGTSISK